MSYTKGVRGAKEKQKDKAQTFLRGAMILSVCGVVGKVLGAVYRIPLTNILGAEGIGLYQIVFPLYALLLTVSGTGLPTAISRLIAERRALGDFDGARDVERVTMRSLLFSGIFFSVAVFLLADLLAKMQGNALAGLAYRGIAPAIAFVAVISAYRGYFQGRRNMVPSAISQLTEQAVKLTAGLLSAYFLRPYGVRYAVMGACAAVSLSELVTMISLIIIKIRRPKDEYSADYVPAARFTVLKEIYKISIPITLGGLILPLTQTIDSVMIINILKADHGARVATALYGLATGPISSLINLPAIISLSIGAATLPAISHLRTRGEKKELSSHIGEIVKMTMVFTLPCFLGMMLLARPIMTLLYGRSLSAIELSAASEMLAVSSVGVFYLSFLQVFTAVIQGMGKTMVPVYHLFVGAVIKIALSSILLLTIGIMGAVIATTTCYLVAAILNTRYMVSKLEIKIDIRKTFLMPLAASAVAAICFTGLQFSLDGHIGGSLALLTAVGLGSVVYACALGAFGVFDPVAFVRSVIKGRRAKENLSAAM